eukprot:5015180-Pleurochrysis_carterae.AAC.1
MRATLCEGRKKCELPSSTSSAAAAAARTNKPLEHHRNKQNFKTSPRAKGADSGRDDALTPAAGAISPSFFQYVFIVPALHIANKNLFGVSAYW